MKYLPVVLENTGPPILGAAGGPRHYIGGGGSFRFTPPVNGKPAAFHVKPDVSVVVGEDGLPAFDGMLDCVADHPDYGKHWALKTVEEMLRQLILKAHQEQAENSNELVAYVDDFLTSLGKAPVLWDVCVPIENFNLPSGIEELEIGGGRLMRMTSDLRDSWRERLFDVIDHSSEPDASKQASRQQFASVISDQLTPVSFVAEVCAADGTRATEVATGRASLVCDLLQLQVPFKYPPSHRAIVQVQGEVYASRRWVLAAAPESFSLDFQNTGAQTVVRLDPEHLSWWRGEFAPVLAAASSRSLSEMQTRTLDAVEWAASAVREETDKARVMKYFIAWERLLAPGQAGGGNAHGLAECTAFLVAKDPNVRGAIYKRCKELYHRCRSKTSHGQQPPIMAEDIGYVHEAVIRLIAAIGKRFDNWERVEQLHTWVRKQSFGNTT